MPVNIVPMTGSLASIGGTALSLTAGVSTPINYEVKIVAAHANTTHVLYVGKSTVTAGTAGATTDGYALILDAAVSIPANFCGGDAKNIFVISSATGDACNFIAY